MPTALEVLQQKLNARAGKTDSSGGKAVLTPEATATTAPPQMPPRTQTPGTAYGDKWADVIPGTSGYGKLARPGQQSWFDWFSKSYNQDPTDMAKVAADSALFHMAPRAVQGMQYLHNTSLGTAMPVPKNWTPAATQQGIQDAYDRLGPGSLAPQALGYAVGSLLGVGPVGKGMGLAADALLPSAAKVAAKVAPAAAKYVPENLIPRMVEGGNFAGAVGAGKTYGGGGSPSDAALAYAENLPVGAALTGALGVVPMGARTPADITRLTKENLKMGDVTIPRKNLGFTVESGPGQFADNPTLAQIEELRKSLQSTQPKSYVPPETGFRSQYDTQVGSEEPGYTGPPSKPVADRDATASNPVLQEPVRQSKNAGGTIQDILLQKIANALPQTLDQKYMAAMDQAKNAETLQRMRDNVGLPGFDPRPQAAQLSQTYPVGSSENEAFQSIARVPDSSDLVGPKGRSAMITAGGLLGEGVNLATGARGGGTGGAYLANQGADLLNYLANRGTGARGIQQMIDQQYKPLTGWSIGPGGNQAFSNTMLRLYGAGVNNPFGAGAPGSTPGYSSQ